MSTNTTESPITVTVDHDPRGVSVDVWQGSHCVYSGAHPLPASPGASTAKNPQPSRDWELTCHECDGSGHVYVKHQVAERKTDMQEFKEECECCEGRGFVFAFQDIPGIEEYVKACSPAPAAAGVSTVEDAGAHKVVIDFDQVGSAGPFYVFDGRVTIPAVTVMDLVRMAAPAAGDALDLTLAQKYEDACIVANANAQDAERYRSVRNCPTLVMSYGDIGGGQDLDARVDAHRAAIAAQRKGDA